MMKPLRNTYTTQSGSMILEALISLLIFSMGILAIVGLQAASVSASTEARYRTEASMLANQLIGQMWVSNRTSAVLQAYSSTAAYTAWLASVAATLPGVATNPPTISVVPNVGPNTTSSVVTVTIFWKAPSEPAANPAHQFVAIAQII
jgi:type IV pilus assembly protein PilV